MFLSIQNVITWIHYPLQLSRMFNHWRSSLVRVEELKQWQADYVAQRNKELMQRLLGEWRQKLQSALVTRSFTQKLLLAVLQAWHVHAKGLTEFCCGCCGSSGCCCCVCLVCFFFLCVCVWLFLFCLWMVFRVGRGM